MPIISVSIHKNGLIFDCIEVDSNNDISEWHTIISSLASQAFSHRDIILATESAAKTLIDTARTDLAAKSTNNHRFENVNFSLFEFQNISEYSIREITQNKNFILSGAWVLQSSMDPFSDLKQLMMIRRCNPTDPQRLFDCRSEFMVCDGDGLMLIWGGVTMSENDAKNIVCKLNSHSLWDIKIVDYLSRPASDK